ncbi:MAG: preprotein translocase subunit SecA [Terriglobia bacterium]
MGDFFQVTLGKIIGTMNDRELKRLDSRVGDINALEPAMKALADADFALKTAEFKQRVAGGATLDDLLTEAFAVCREVGRRALNMRHFDVQLIGGMALHEGKIAEMKTGEGKTLVATLPVYLNSLEGKGVHVVTVNDYLARRDAAWMGPIYRMLGLSVGVILHDLDEEERRAAYGADVTYGTNNEFGFDYLRDNMKFELPDLVQREHNFAIVDEVDSILIDEARTPLIISGASEESTEKYYRIDKIIPVLEEGKDYDVDEKLRTASITETGVEKAEKALGVENLYDPSNADYIHHVYQAIRAHALFKLDRDYVVKDGEVIIVDEFTGRLMPGRRWSDGLHQAIEAKEGVKIEKENQTLATITFQNYFRMYEKLAGMTGTAETEAAEFEKIYELEVIVIPTNRDLIRIEHPDVVYRTEREKFNASIEEIKEYYLRGQPVLVGTIAIEKSERLNAQLKKSGLLPARLQELLKAASLEGAKLQKWVTQLAEQHGPAMEWLIKAGATPGAAKKTLGQRAFQSIAQSMAQSSTSNGAGAAFLEALVKSGHSGKKSQEGQYGPNGLPVMNEGAAAQIAALVKWADGVNGAGGTKNESKIFPILDYLAEIRCTPQRFAEVIEAKEMKHYILNAKQHEKEALIVAQAGRMGAVTVSTNMAGRGTDILLGGNPEFMAREEFRKSPEKYREQGIDPEPPELPASGSSEAVFEAYVKDYQRWRDNWTQFQSRFKAVTDVEHDRVIELGGLHILGTERHEARRIDNQLRGRAGRQGDPGSSRFYLSLEDDLLRIFAGERISKIMHRLGMEEGVPIESGLITKRIKAAQKSVEGQNFESRKHLLEYDDVMNKQRETIYGRRKELLEGKDQQAYAMEAVDRVVAWLVDKFCPKDKAQDWNQEGLKTEFWNRFGVDLRKRELVFDPKNPEALTEELRGVVRERYEEREKMWGPERMRVHERMIMLQVVDGQWKEHLLAMDHLKEGIGLRGYGQRDPLVEYKRESYDMFEDLMDRIEDESLRYLFLLRTPEEEETMIREYQRRKRREQAEMRMVGAGAVMEKPQQVIRREKIGRNDPCPCGSGKKYKKCHGAQVAPPPAPSGAAPDGGEQPVPEA